MNFGAQTKILLLNCKKSHLDALRDKFGDAVQLMQAFNEGRAVALLRKSGNRVIVLSINPGIGDLITLNLLKRNGYKNRMIAMSAYKTGNSKVELFNLGLSDDIWRIRDLSGVGLRVQGMPGHVLQSQNIGA